MTLVIFYYFCYNRVRCKKWSAGSDNIPLAQLKRVGSYIVKSLRYLFNNFFFQVGSFLRGMVRLYLRIFEKKRSTVDGKIQTCGSFFSFSKIFVYGFFSQILNFLSKFNFINTHQHLSNLEAQQTVLIMIFMNQSYKRLSG